MFPILSSRILASAFAVASLFAQDPQGAPAGGGAAAGTAGGAGANNPTAPAGGNTGRQPTIGEMPGRTTREPIQQMPEMQRMIYLSGKVLMDDGQPPPESVLIERVCNGQPKPEGYTDQKGRFHFQLGQNNALLADASVSNSNDIFGDSAIGSNRRTGMPGGLNERELMGCEIRASLAGFRSDVVNLAGRRALDNPDVGTIILHRLAKVDGFTFSGTSAFAPKDSRKAFDKGRELVRKKKFPEAEKELSKAVEIYPKYAVAWYELGMLHQQQNKLEEARHAYSEALKADEKYVSPYAQLALLAASEQKWDETVDWSGKLIKLNPYHSPQIYFYNAMAKLNTQRLDEAEEAAREAVKLDAGGRLPRVRYLLGIVLAQKGKFKESAENMKFYLNKAPNAPDVETVKKQLAEVQRQLTPQEASAKE